MIAGAALAVDSARVDVLRARMSSRASRSAAACSRLFDGKNHSNAAGRRIVARARARFRLARRVFTVRRFS